MITMTGFDRTFEVPLAVRAAAANVNHPLATLLAGGRVSAWDVVIADPAGLTPEITRWTDKLTRSVIVSAGALGAAVLDCPECEDTGFYGLPDPAEPEILRQLVRSVGGGYETLQADGRWIPYVATGPEALEIIGLDVAEDLADALTAGASGMMRRYSWPQAFLAPTAILAASEGVPAAATEGPGWHNFAVVDELDTGAVIQLIRMKAGPALERYEWEGEWVKDPAMLASLTGVKPPPLVELDEAKTADVIKQIDGNPENEPKAVKDPEAKTASGLVADAKLKVSPNKGAEKLRRYWSTGGKGGLKIRWGTPGDWTRCYKHLKKYMGVRAKGYCNNMHKRNTGKWSGSKVASAAMMMSTEAALVAALTAGTWSGDNREGTNMTGIKDGVYSAQPTRGVARALVASAFPVTPPDDWFEDPVLSSLTPLTIEDSGRVYGHLASWDMPHIGMPGQVRAPRSASNYAFFRTGQLRTASGAKVAVGQLTSVGGHAPLSADASMAVKHYDDTNSAMADVVTGEDAHGIWFAGALRPDATPEKLRAFQASALSGDWRPINGRLELVAACSVNVPGFPIARTMVAGGAIVALVAAGAEVVAIKAASLLADAAVLERIENLEAALADRTAATADSDELTPTPAPDDASAITPDPEASEKIKRAREMAAAAKTKAAEPAAVEAPAAEPTVSPARQALRDRIKAAKGGDASPKADAAVTAASSGWQEWLHPRDRGGQFIEKGGIVNITGLNADFSKPPQRAQIIDLTERGPMVEYSYDKKREIIPLAQVADRITVAPKARADIGGTPDNGLPGLMDRLSALPAQPAVSTNSPLADSQFKAMQPIAQAKADFGEDSDQFRAAMREYGSAAGLGAQPGPNTLTPETYNANTPAALAEGKGRFAGTPTVEEALEQIHLIYGVNSEEGRIARDRIDNDLPLGTDSAGNTIGGGDDLGPMPGEDGYDVGLGTIGQNDEEMFGESLSAPAPAAPQFGPKNRDEALANAALMHGKGSAKYKAIEAKAKKLEQELAEIEKKFGKGSKQYAAKVKSGGVLAIVASAADTRAALRARVLGGNAAATTASAVVTPREALRARVHGAPVTAGLFNWNEWKHPRDAGGRFIEVGGVVNVDVPYNEMNNGQGAIEPRTARMKRKATVLAFDKDGVVVEDTSGYQFKVPASRISTPDTERARLIELDAMAEDRRRKRGGNSLSIGTEESGYFEGITDYGRAD